MNKEALEFYKSVKQDADFKTILKKGFEFQNYLDCLGKSIVNQDLKDDFIFQWTLKNVLKNEKDIRSYSKANIFSALRSLLRILNRIENKGLNNVTKRMLIDFICDLKSFIVYFDESQDYSWLIGNTNTHMSNFYNSLSNNIFWDGKPGENPHELIVLASSTPFVIRQSIEYKIKRILGIDYLMVNNKPDIKTIEKCFKAIDINKSYYVINNFDFEKIKQIYSWTHPYIHGGYRPEPWKTEIALNYLNNIFYNGETSKKNNYSVNAGVQVKKSDLPKLKSLTEKSLMDSSDGNLKIKWLRNPEVAAI